MNRNKSKSNPDQWPDCPPRAPEAREYERRTALCSIMSLSEGWRKACGLRNFSTSCLSLSGCTQAASCLGLWRWHPGRVTETMNLTSCKLQVNMLGSATWNMIQFCLDDFLWKRDPSTGRTALIPAYPFFQGNFGCF